MTQVHLAQLWVKLQQKLQQHVSREVEAYTAHETKVADSRTSPIVGYAPLQPFKVVGVVRDIKGTITELESDCFLDSNFIRTFQTIHDPTKKTFIVQIADETVDLGVMAKSSTNVTILAFIGIADITS